MEHIWTDTNDHNKNCSMNSYSLGKGFYGSHPAHEINVFTTNFPIDCRSGSKQSLEWLIALVDAENYIFDG